MNWINFFIVNIPETFLSLLLGDLLIFRMKGSRARYYLISLLIIPLYLHFWKNSDFSDLMPLFSIPIYVICFMHVFKMNFRQSLFAGSFVMFLLMLMELLSLDYMISMSNVNGLKDHWYYLFVLAVPIRVIQVVIGVLLWKYEISLEKSIVMVKDWNSLGLRFKLEAIMISIFILSLITATYAYFYLSIQMMFSGLNLGMYGGYLKYAYWFIFFLLGYGIVFVAGSFEGSNARAMLTLIESPRDMMLALAESATQEERDDYMRILLKSSFK